MIDEKGATEEEPPSTGQEVIPDAIERMAMGELPRIWMVILIGFVAILFTIVWLNAYLFLNDAIWKNSFVMNNHWTLPAGALLFSLLVGLSEKYLDAPNAIKGSLVDSIKGGEELSYRRFPGTLVSSFCSLLSGVSVGPEGPLGFLVQEIAGWIEDKLRIVKESRLGFKVAALASAYNGIVGTPLFTAVLATEIGVGKRDRLLYLGWNLLAGVIGYFVFVLLGFHSFLGEIPFPPIRSNEVVYIVYAIILGGVGTMLTLFVVSSFRLSGKLMARFSDRVVLRTLIAGAITASIIYFFPEVSFSGENQIHQIVDNATQYGVAMLLLFTVLKVLLLGLALKGGFLGGPIFPTLFACTTLSLAIGLVFPDVPIIIIVLCIEGAAFTLLLGGPLTAILLVGAVTSEGLVETYLTGLIVVAIVTSMLIGMVARRIMTRRGARTSGRPEGGGPA